jgi:NAD(P)-dependent dehydrogenase (short-subunit alcohol dehydrogenase family)
MKVIVITGSTRGIGLGLTKAFLERGCAVVISGRSQESVEKATAELAKTFKAEQLFGYPCDVSRFDQLLALWQAAWEHFGQVDVWINNAGMNHPALPMWEISPEQTRQVVEANILGVIYGSQVALRGMREQGFGQIYNMEGFGSDGRTMIGMSVYGGSKYAVHYLTQSLVKDAAGTPIVIGALSPGMVITDMITNEERHNPQKWEQNKRVFNILGDRVEIVTPWLAEKILQNNKTGARIAWLTSGKIMLRFALARFQKRNLFN